MSSLSNQAQQPHLLQPTSTEKLEAHAKFIRACIAGQRKGSAEIFGYAFLAGHRMLLAKADVPHGNSHGPAGTAFGLKKWAEDEFGKDVPYRTLTRWMEFADGINGHFSTIKNKRVPLLLSRNKINAADRPLILKAVLQVMDGKSMLSFMRDSRLLRDPEKAAHHPRKETDPEKVLQATKKHAARHWKTITADLTLGQGIIRHLDPEPRRAAAVACLSSFNQLIKLEDPKSQQEFLGVLVDSSNAIRKRAQLKA